MHLLAAVFFDGFVKQSLSFSLLTVPVKKENH